MNHSIIGQLHQNPAFNGLVFNDFTTPSPLIPSTSEIEMLCTLLRVPAIPHNGPPKTLMHYLQDKSGSMTVGLSQTIIGYNKMIDALQVNGEKIGIEFSQTQFDNNIHAQLKNVPIHSVKHLDSMTYVANGGTSLYDAVAYAVKEILKHKDVHNSNTAIMLSINTDGADEHSTAWGNKSANYFMTRLMKAISENPRWTISLSGPVNRLSNFAKEMSIPYENIAGFVPESVDSRIDAANSNISAMNSYMNARSMGATQANNLYCGTVSGNMAMSTLKHPEN